MSITMERAFAPFCSIGVWHATAIVSASWLLPVRYSPKTQVIEPVSMPPPRMWSRSSEPVVMRMSDSWRAAATSRPDWNWKRGHSFRHSSWIFATLASERPLMSASFLGMVMQTRSTVW